MTLNEDSVEEELLRSIREFKKAMIAMTEHLDILAEKIIERLDSLKESKEQD